MRVLKFCNIDINKYKGREDGMEECSGGFGNESLDLDRLRKDKQKGGKRTSPQQNPELRKVQEKWEKQILKCPQCDFISQNETFFNEHMTKVHSGQPNCPFCFLPFQEYAALRKHCRAIHEESSHNSNERKLKGQSGRIVREDLPEGGRKRRPCRYFRNGEGKCTPNRGSCDFDHSIIPFSEREECFHKQKCHFKPFCIFVSP